jgi:hypothetical protein
MATYVTDHSRKAARLRARANPTCRHRLTVSRSMPGRWCRRTMTPAPARVRMSRGCAVVLEYKDGTTTKLRWLSDGRVESAGQ